MSRSCATPVIFHYLDRLAGRAAQDKQLRTHSKSWDCSDVLHGVAARETHQGTALAELKGEGRGVHVDFGMCDSTEASGALPNSQPPGLGAEPRPVMAPI
jgi:hypothetical protein